MKFHIDMHPNDLNYSLIIPLELYKTDKVHIEITSQLLNRLPRYFQYNSELIEFTVD